MEITMAIATSLMKEGKKLVREGKDLVVDMGEFKIILPHM